MMPTPVQVQFLLNSDGLDLYMAKASPQYSRFLIDPPAGDNQKLSAMVSTWGRDVCGNNTRTAHDHSVGLIVADKDGSG